MLHTPDDFLRDFKGTILDPESEAYKEMMSRLPDPTPEGTQPKAPKLRPVEEFWERCDIPYRFRHRESDLTRVEAWSSLFVRVKHIIDYKPGFIIVVRGPYGTGKTQLAVEALRYAYCEKNKTVMMTSARKIQLETIASFKDPKRTDKDVLINFIKPAVLLIDEFDRKPDWKPEELGGYHNSNLFHILDERYQWLKPTILTSNATKEAFESNTDPAILSRISESGGRIDTDKLENLRTA